MGDKATQILIVEDDAQLRASLKDLIGDIDNVDISHLAGSLAEARRANFAQIDLALLDIGLPDGLGIELISELRDARPDVRVLIFTVFGDRDSVLKAFDAGADGFILKDSGAREIGEAIASVLDGGVPISARAAAYLLQSYRAETYSNNAASDKPKLSPRELELLQFLARGFSYKEAARKMNISPSTVSEYASSLYKKLAVNSRGAAVFEAMQNGLLNL